MRVCQLRVTNFRGIRTLDWSPCGQTYCLIGPGDSTKTTILDALELVLTPRWSISLDDSDFHCCDTSTPIRIEVTLRDLPEEFKNDEKFGLHLRGWTTNGTLREEPQDDDEQVLTIALTVDASLEPVWEVVTAGHRHEENRRISSKDRSKLGVVRIGDYTDRHLSWADGSLLSRLTKESGGSISLLADVSRAAKEALNLEDLTDIQAVADAVEEQAKHFGVATTSKFQPHLDIRSVSVSNSGLALHQGNVPLRRSGLGTRRLTALALQLKAARTRGLTLIDEVENGLEPFRLRHLMKLLLEADSQILMATHSSVALGELDAAHIAVVRCEAGETSIHTVHHSLRSLVRKNPEALLARKILVCEGKTELGFCRGLDQWWAGEESPAFASSGVALVNGGGSETGTCAMGFAGLGYDTLILADSDRPLQPARAELESAGVQVVLWSDAMAIEERIANDLPLPSVRKLVNLAITERDLTSVRAAVIEAASVDADTVTQIPDEWSNALGETAYRKAVGGAAKTKGWFKRVDLAEELAHRVVGPALASIPETDLNLNLADLKSWAHA